MIEPVGTEIEDLGSIRIQLQRRIPVFAVGAADAAERGGKAAPAVGGTPQAAVLTLRIHVAVIFRIDPHVKTVAAVDLLPVVKTPAEGTDGAVVLGSAVEPLGLLIIDLPGIELGDRQMV